MRINEDNFMVFSRVDTVLKQVYPCNINDDTFQGYIDDEVVLTIIEDLCDEIEILREKLKEQNENDYPEEERDREKEVLGI